MVKYKYTLTWLIMFAIALVIAIILMGPGGEPDITNPGIIVGAVLVLFCCPAFIYDKKHTENYKLKQEEKKLKLHMEQERIQAALKQQHLDLERKKLAIESEKIELAQRTRQDFKYCTNCGKQIEYSASVCPFCGFLLEIKSENVIQTTPQPPQQIIIQEAPKPNIWKQLGAWIISEITYCIIFTIMMSLMIVMMFLFLA
ncbi:MAG: hypothetical protein ACFFEY_03435 [Candidatus Thorarchaeota archaeon]